MNSETGRPKSGPYPRRAPAAGAIPGQFSGCRFFCSNPVAGVNLIGKSPGRPGRSPFPSGVPTHGRGHRYRVETTGIPGRTTSADSGRWAGRADPGREQAVPPPVPPEPAAALRLRPHAPAATGPTRTTCSRKPASRCGTSSTRPPRRRTSSPGRGASPTTRCSTSTRSRSAPRRGSAASSSSAWPRPPRRRPTSLQLDDRRDALAACIEKLAAARPRPAHPPLRRRRDHAVHLRSNSAARSTPFTRRCAKLRAVRSSIAFRRALAREGQRMTPESPSSPNCSRSSTPCARRRSRRSNSGGWKNSSSTTPRPRRITSGS